MARSRNIKPGFFKNEDLCDIDQAGRLLFIGLWCLADREGRLEDRPKRIKMELFPCDMYDTEAGLSALARLGFIERYAVDGRNIIQITKFLQHQTPHGTEKDSELPDKAGNLTVHERNKVGYATGVKRCKNVISTVINVIPEENNVKEQVDNTNPTGSNGEPTVTEHPDSLIHRFTDSLIQEPNPPSLRDVPPKEKKLTFKAWLEKIAALGERPISAYRPVFDYAEAIGLPSDWIQIAWIKFSERYTKDKNNSSKRYIDWRQVFLNAIKDNWFKLWYAKDGVFFLTTPGVQADIETRESA